MGIKAPHPPPPTPPPSPLPKAFKAPLSASSCGLSTVLQLSANLNDIPGSLNSLGP